MTLNPCNTYAYHHLMYKYHDNTARRHEAKADQHASWIMAREEYARRLLTEHDKERHHLESLITTVAPSNGGTKSKVRRAPTGRFIKADKAAEVAS